MSSGEPRRQPDSSGWLSTAFGLLGGSYAALGLLALGLVLILMVLVTLSGFGGSTAATGPKPQEANALDDARQTLEHDADVSACRAALQQINVALGSRTDLPRPPALDASQRERLKNDLGLGDDDLSEVGAENYTLLDGWHLAGAFLFRDAAAHVLEPEEVGANLPRPALLEQATAAFAWAVREVRLAPPTPVGVTPPQFVVRRGSGTPLERALVFLDLLDQLNAAGEGSEEKPGDAGRPPALLGCLVFCKGHEPVDASGGAADPWACGVMIDGKPDVYLFDPRLGLPLPGEGGKGVATLADVCSKPALLDRLKVDGAPAYDVTPEQARTAELHLVFSLSALTPRMEVLQDKLLPPVRVALARNLDRETMQWRQAAEKTEGVKPAVKVWREGPTLLRQFLPPEEGGADKGWPGGFALRDLVGFTDPDDPARVQMLRYALFRMQVAPWDVMPPQFHDLTKFPYNVGLGQRVRDNFMAPFGVILLEPKGPRDRLLRGDFDQAAGDLVGFSARMEQQQRNRAEAGSEAELEKQVDEWARKAVAAYAKQLRAQDHGTPAEREEADKEVEAVWKASAPVKTLLEGASSVPGLAEVTYQLGLCKHERAEQAQARLELLGPRPGQKVSPLEAADVRTAWMDALGWWKKYGDGHPEESANRPSSCPGRAAAVRRMRARAQAMLGDWQAAAATLEDPSEPPVYPMERLAALYLARQLKAGHAGAGQ